VHRRGRELGVDLVELHPRRAELEEVERDA